MKLSSLEKIINDSEYRKGILFSYGFLMGVVCFILVYGVKVLNPFNDAWIMALPDRDIQQHYLGWCHFRNTPWHFPLGLIDTLSYPYSQSCLWTDSIPLFAILFKLFRSILPETFNYLGFYGCLSMALMGGFSALLTDKITEGLPSNKYLPFLTVFAYILSYPILQRMFYHTSLTAHYFILIGMLIILEGPLPLKKSLALWAGTGFLIILIHPYLWAMFMLMEFCDLLVISVRSRRPKHSVITFIVSILTGVFGLYIEGAFYGNVGASYGIGGYEANMNSLFNSMGMGKLLPELPLSSGTQYEGFGYMGAGMLLLGIIAVVLIIIYAVKNHSRLVKYIKTHDSFIIFAIIVICSGVFSLLPIVSFGRYSLKLKFPQPIESFIGIFRSTGRFIWPVLYILMTAIIFVVAKRMKESLVIPLIFACLLIQFVDLSDLIAQKHETFTEDYKPYKSDLEDPRFLAVVDRYSHFIITHKNLIRIMDAAYYGYKHDITLNKFYYARSNDALFATALNKYIEKAASGKPEADCIYLFERDELDKYRSLPLYFYDIDGTVFGVSKPIPDLEELR